MMMNDRWFVFSPRGGKNRRRRDDGDAVERSATRASIESRVMMCDVMMMMMM